MFGVGQAFLPAFFGRKANEQSLADESLESLSLLANDLDPACCDV